MLHTINRINPLLKAIRDHLKDQLPIQLGAPLHEALQSWFTIWHGTEHLATVRIREQTIQDNMIDIWCNQPPHWTTIQIADPNLLTKIQERLHDQIHKETHRNAHRHRPNAPTPNDKTTTPTQFPTRKLT